MAFKNYYDILGVQQTATQQEIKQAYRKLSVKFHPDKNDGDSFLEEMFKNINEANEILSDSQKRKIFDKTLKEIVIPTSNSEYDDGFADLDHDTLVELTEMLKLIQTYFDKEKITKNKYSNLLNANYIPKPSFLSATKVLFTILIMGILVWYFKIYPSESKAEEIQQVQTIQYEWVVTEDAVVFSRPDINSSVIGRVSVGSGFNGLKETNYFIKVSFNDVNGYPKEGYIRKTQMKKN